MNFYRNMNFSIVILCSVFIVSAYARPWNVSNLESEVSVMSQNPSPIIQTIDSMTTGFSRTLKSYSPSLTPILGMSSLAYVAYVGAVMYFPKTLKDAGVPLLDDFKFESRTTRTAESSGGFIDSLATGFMKDMIMRTAAATVLRNTSLNAVKSGMGTLKKTTRFLNSELGHFRSIVNRVVTALDPKCLARYMCQIGQFTSLRVPALGPMLRSINTFDLDDYSQALIDGTTVGDCKAVYFECPL